MDREQREELIQQVADKLGCTRAEVMQRFAEAVLEATSWEGLQRFAARCIARGRELSPDVGTIPTTDEILLAELLAGKQDFMIVGSVVSSADFALAAHKQIFQRMADLYERRETINRVTVANELMMHGELESCGELSYLVRLDDYLWIN